MEQIEFFRLFSTSIQFICFVGGMSSYAFVVLLMVPNCNTTFTMIEIKYIQCI